MRAFYICCRAKKAIHVRGFPDSSTGKESGCNAGEPGSIPGWGKNPLEKGYATHSSILGLTLGLKLVKNPPAMWEIWVQTGTHCSVLAWRIPCTVWSL